MKNPEAPATFTCKVWAPADEQKLYPGLHIDENEEPPFAMITELIEDRVRINTQKLLLKI